MASWLEHPTVIAARGRSHTIDLVLRAVTNFRDHRTGRNSALVAHYAFLSVFPLIIVFTTSLGYLLQSHETLRNRIENSAFERVPIIGSQLSADPQRLQGDLLVLVFALVTTLWAGLRAFNVLQAALNDVANIPLGKRPGLLRTRARSLAAIAVVGGAQLVTAVLTGFVGVTGVRGLHKILFTVAAISVNTFVVAMVYRWLVAAPRTWQQVAPGAICVGIIFAGLQLIGTAIVGRAIAKASPVYGTFASVIGLISWLGLHSMVGLLGAELNEVLLREPEVAATVVVGPSDQR